MRVVKNEKGFPAILKDQQECVLAEGFASVLEESNSVEFRSDFVPLYPMGVPMKVVRRFQNQDIHIFWGEVYISDQKLLPPCSCPGSFGSGFGKRIFHIGFYVRTLMDRKKMKELESAPKPSRFSLFRRKKQEKKTRKVGSFQLIFHKTYCFIWKWIGVYFLLFAGTRR